MTVVRVPLAAILLASVSVGCHTVQPLAVNSIPQVNPPVVFVTYKDNSQVAVEKPRVSGDSLYGKWQGLDEEVVVPLSAVQSIESLQRNPKRTLTAVVGISAATIAGTYLILKFAGLGRNCDASRGNTDQQGDSPAVGECGDRHTPVS